MPVADLTAAFFTAVDTGFTAVFAAGFAFPAGLLVLTSLAGALVAGAGDTMAGVAGATGAGVAGAGVGGGTSAFGTAGVVGAGVGTGLGSDNGAAGVLGASLVL